MLVEAELRLVARELAPERRLGALDLGELTASREFGLPPLDELNARLASALVGLGADPLFELDVRLVSDRRRLGRFEALLGDRVIDRPAELDLGLHVLVRDRAGPLEDFLDDVGIERDELDRRRPLAAMRLDRVALVDRPARARRLPAHVPVTAATDRDPREQRPRSTDGDAAAGSSARVELLDGLEGLDRDDRVEAWVGVDEARVIAPAVVELTQIDAVLQHPARRHIGDRPAGPRVEELGERSVTPAFEP